MEIKSIIRNIKKEFKILTKTTKRVKKTAETKNKKTRRKQTWSFKKLWNLN